MSAVPFVVRRKNRISSQDWEALVRQRAWWLFLEREPGRRYRDWLDAISQCGLYGVFVTSKHPRWAEIQTKAHQIWLNRKDRDAEQDWFDAEAIVNREYEVV